MQKTATIQIKSLSKVEQKLCHFCHKAEQKTCHFFIWNLSFKRKILAKNVLSKEQNYQRLFGVNLAAFSPTIPL